MADNCVFCKIASGQIPASKIWEDEKFLAILDINPNTKGATLLLSKEHYPSRFSEMPDDLLKDIFPAAGKVARLLEKSLSVPRVALVVEGVGVNHSHLKLYPLFASDQEIGEAKERTFFEKYPGYVSTQLGPQSDLAELAKLAEEIRKNA